MAKYRLLRERLLAHGVVSPEQIFDAPSLSAHEVLSTHTADYWERVEHGTLSAFEVRRIGFPWSPQLVERSRRSAGATLAAARHALAWGFGANLAGGTHHAYADHGEGYCVLNDLAITARCLRREGLVDRVLIVDLDVHQGNGTAAIFAHAPEVFTLSLHGRRNFPAHKERSDLDLELEDGCGDAEYLDTLALALDRALSVHHPDLVLYLAGADIWEGDRLGRLAVSRDGIAARDRLVLECCRALELPVAVAMGGGYAPDAADIAAIHAATITLGLEIALREHAEPEPRHGKVPRRPTNPGEHAQASARTGVP
jgi:acetoin utilization deacetylase AcuC-like enzyme